MGTNNRPCSAEYARAREKQIPTSNPICALSNRPKLATRPQNHDQYTEIQRITIMKTLKIHHMVACLSAIALLAGCRTTPPPQTSIPTPDPQAKQQAFGRPLVDTHKAASDAMVEIGCVINRDEPTFIQGARPMTSGLVTTSGGEVVRVWLESQGTNQTVVKVFTICKPPSFLAMGLASYAANRAGMKHWEEDVLSSMAQALK